MSCSTDMRVRGVALHFIPVSTRVPLKFGTEALTTVTCARVQVRVEGRDGRQAFGWGETPLSVQWVWPSAEPYEPRHRALQSFCERIASAWSKSSNWGHALELGHDFVNDELPQLLNTFNAARASTHGNRSESAEAATAGQGVPDEALPQTPMPWLAALVSASAFDLALHDAFGRLHERPTYSTYNAEYLGRDLGDFLKPDADLLQPDWFRGRYPADFLNPTRRDRLVAWHLVGGLDPLEQADLTGAEPDDGYPVLLTDWIRRDGLQCLKVKLRGSDSDWDLDRLLRVGRIAIEQGVTWLTADFNCTVQDPEYVTRILDVLRDEHPRLHGMLLYVEQPFPYELEEHPIPVFSVSARKPLFLDESAHDWRQVQRGRELGWTGVALKTCKTQTGALLSACWASAHGMTLMVQDLTNPMLAQVTHTLLAAHVPTIQGVETNAMQFYPDASAPEAVVHPGLYRRRDGHIDLATVTGPGFGHRETEIQRQLPAPIFVS